MGGLLQVTVVVLHFFYYNTFFIIFLEILLILKTNELTVLLGGSQADYTSTRSFRSCIASWTRR